MEFSKFNQNSHNVIIANIVESFFNWFFVHFDFWFRPNNGLFTKTVKQNVNFSFELTKHQSILKSDQTNKRALKIWKKPLIECLRFKNKK